MSETKKRKVHTPELAAKVDLETVRGVKAIDETTQAYAVHPQVVRQCKKDILESD